MLVRPFEADTSSIAPVEIEPVDFFAPSAIALLLQHLALTFAALSLVRDRQLGLLELLRVGPLSSVEILVGKTVAYLVVGLAVGASLVAAAVYVLGVPLQGEVLWVAAVVVLVLLASLSLGMILSMISGSETQAVQFAMLSLLAGMFFSGFFLDVSQLALPYRYVSYLLPVTYGINVLQDVMLRGAEPASGRPRRARRARRRLRFAGRAAAATEAASRMTDTDRADSSAHDRTGTGRVQPTPHRPRRDDRRRRRRGDVRRSAPVVAWQLLGDLRTRSAASLDLLERTLTNVDETLAIAQDVTTTVGDSLDTIRDSLTTLSAGVGDGAAALDSVADLTEDVPPALDRLDATLVDLGEAAGVVDSALEALDEIPIGPDFDADAGLAASVDGVRDDIRPIAEDLRGSTDSIRELSGSSDDLVTQLAELDGDLDRARSVAGPQPPAARQLPRRHRRGDHARRGEPGRPRPRHRHLPGARRGAGAVDRRRSGRPVPHRPPARRHS